jgi:hypothetical protein
MSLRVYVDWKREAVQEQGLIVETQFVLRALMNM